MADETPKIIIDEDWKARANREKEEAAAKAAAEQAAKAAPAAPVTPHADAEAPAEPAVEAPAPAEPAAVPAQAAPEEGDVPPPGAETPFMALVASLATQAMFALGVIAPQGQKEVMINIEQAQYAIEMLATLKEKTAGNLTPEESAQLNEATTELQQIYAARVQQLQEQTLRQAGVNLDELRGPRP